MSDVGVIFALAAEQGCFEDLLSEVVTLETPAGKVRRGKLGEVSVTTIVSGPGNAASARAAETIIQGDRPRWLISAGFCGGLQPDLPRYAIIAADRLLDLDGSTLVLDAWERAGLELSNIRRGTLVTVDRIVVGSEEKRALGERTCAAACEMESLAAARVCAERSVPLLVVRVVSDPVDEDLPADLDRLMRQTTAAGLLGAALGAVWRRPASVKDLWRLKEQALIAADRLAKCLAELIGQFSKSKPALGTEHPVPSTEY